MCQVVCKVLGVCKVCKVLGGGGYVSGCVGCLHMHVNTHTYCRVGLEAGGTEGFHLLDLLVSWALTYGYEWFICMSVCLYRRALTGIIIAFISTCVLMATGK